VAVDTGERVILYKRWTLRRDVDVGRVTALVRDAIVPQYERLSGDVTLGLELAADGRSILAIQRWRSRSALVDATRGPRFERWWSDYQPILSAWATMLELDSEWETVEVLA
jgi:hypothetical protein